MSLEAALTRWTLSRPEPVADTATSQVYKALDSQGVPVAVKILKPYGADEIEGARLMEWYGGLGSARILDIAEPIILMEWLDGAQLGDMVRTGGDAEAAEILCDVVSDLHGPRGSAPAGLQPLAGRLAPLLETDAAFWPISGRPLVRRAAQIAVDLLATATRSIPLHGDFHHDNVVGSARGWLAIDAKGVLGDPAYELANIFRNPPGAGDLVTRPERAAGLADTFAARLGLDRRRVLGWAAAHCALSGCWDHSAGNPIAWDVATLPVLVEAAERA